MINAILTWAGNITAWIIIVIVGILVYQSIYEHKSNQYSKGINHAGAIGVTVLYVFAILWIMR